MRMILAPVSAGSLGMSTTKGLSAPHQQGTALVRVISTAQPKVLSSAGTPLVAGDLKLRSTLDAALKAIDAVICAASSTLFRQRSGRKPLRSTRLSFFHAIFGNWISKLLM
jgi:hypothetical protein